jgi:hypothetical protein
VVRPPVGLMASYDPESLAFDPEAVTVTWCAAVVCENCGLVRLHALSPLGLKAGS